MFLYLWKESIHTVSLPNVSRCNCTHSIGLRAVSSFRDRFLSSSSFSLLSAGCRRSRADFVVSRSNRPGAYQDADAIPPASLRQSPRIVGNPNREFDLIDSTRLDRCVLLCEVLFCRLHAARLHTGYASERTNERPERAKDSSKSIDR